MICHTRQAWKHRGWALATVAAILLALRFIVFDANAIFIALNAFTPFTYGLGYVSLIIAFFCRARALGAASLVLCAAHIFLLWPPTPQAPNLAEATVVKVMTTNLLHSNRTPEPLAREILQANADILMIQEITGHWLAVLDREGVIAKYPHQKIIFRDNAFGIATLSKFPMETLAEPQVADLPMVDCRAHLEGTTLRLLNVHTAPPTNPANVEIWEQQFALLEGYAANATEPFLMAGDLNATRYNEPLRSLAESGMRNCHAELSKNFVGTFPNGAIPSPDIQIDHVLVNGGVRCEDVKEGEGVGSDHAPITAVLSVGHI